MKLLGQIGINVWLLAAQIVNFALLLWLLSKLIYKPIMRQIEQDEADLRTAQEQKKAVQAERRDFNQWRQKETEASNQRAKTIITEAGAIAQALKEEARRAAEKETAAMIAQTHQTLTSQKPALEANILATFKKNIGGSFGVTFSRQVSRERQKEIQNILFENLLEQLRASAVPKLKEAELASALEEVQTLAPREARRKFADALHQKTGPIIAEYAFEPSAKQKKLLQETVSQKIGADLAITWKKDADLINGFRLELMGFMIESNLLDTIRHAVAYKK